MKPLKKTRIAVLLLVLMFIAAFGLLSAEAKVTYQYFESLTNCDGGGGWLVIDTDPDGSAHVYILCDGGKDGTP